MSIVGVEKESNNRRSTGVLAPVLLRYGAMEDSVTELFEVSHTIAGTFQNLDFVIAALREAVRPGAVQAVQYFPEPIVNCLCTILELRQIHRFYRK